MALGVWYFISQMDKPLGPSLKGNLTKLIVPGKPITGQKTTPGQKTIPGQLPGQDQTKQLPPLCGKTPVLTILAIGIDYEPGGYLYGLADVIRIVRIDFTIHKVSVLTIDRAIWVEIPGISSTSGRKW